MLLDQSLDLQERGQQVPLVLCRVNRISKRLVVVKRLEERIKRVSLLVIRFDWLLGRSIGLCWAMGLFSKRWALSL